MDGIVYFGYLLVAASTALLASNWHQWQSLTARRDGARRRWAFLRLQIQRRTMASAMIGVVGAAMTLAPRVPRDPTSFTAYVLALTLGGLMVLMIGLSDLRATRRQRDREQMELVVEELKKLEQAAASRRE
jgi:hypothetical protein